MKLISTKDYLLLIDTEAEIKEYFKGYIYQPHWKKPVELEDNFISLGYAEEDRKEFGGGKIIAYHPLTKEAKELDLPLLPPFGEEVNFSKWYEDQNYPQADNNSDLFEEEITVESFKWSYMSEAFEAGYKAAQSKQFSLEDVEKAYNYGLNRGSLELGSDFNEFIQSLSTQQLPLSFKPEYEKDITNGWSNVLQGGDGKSKFKIITNSEGKEEIQGNYKY